jgi:hypothetical protein
VRGRTRLMAGVQETRLGRFGRSNIELAGFGVSDRSVQHHFSGVLPRDEPELV